MTPNAETPGAGRYAFRVATGIFLSRLAGLVRERIFSHYFGLSDAGDVFKAAFKIPNFLQNLFGEGVLSASFIPVYARLVAEGDEREAQRVAAVVFSLLALVVSVLVLGGVLAAPWLVELIAPGFPAEKRKLLVQLVQIVFPGIGLLVLSAWCLGVLNSHRRFFLSYAAPLAWNAVMIGTLLGFGPRLEQVPLARAVALGSVAGSALQFLVQLPVVLRLSRGMRLRLDTRSPHLRQVVRSFGPVFVGRGVVQISAYVDSMLASFLTTGAVTALYNAQTLYLLPVSLFGMSVSAAELPLMSGTTGSREEIHAALRDRLAAGLRRIAFFVIPSAAAFLALGDQVTALVYQTGRFGRVDSVYVWAVLAGAAVGLLAVTTARLYASTFYALRDTKTPLYFALSRVGLGVGIGYLAAFQLRRALGLDPRWGVVGLTLASSLAGWVELSLLRRTLDQRIGRTGIPAPLMGRLCLAAALAAGVASALRWALPGRAPFVLGLLMLSLFGGSYLALSWALHVPEARRILARLSRRRRRA